MSPRFFQHISSVRYYLFLLLATLAPYGAPSASAGIITLINGDKVNGELVKLEGDHMHWASENFGTLVISTDRIAKIETLKPLKINGHDDACILTGMSRGRMLLLCGDKEEYSHQIRLVKTLLPYQSFVQGAYSYRGKVSAAGYFAEGNAKQLDWDVDTDIEFRQGDYRHRMAAVYDSRLIDGTHTDQIFDLQYQLDVFFHERWFSYSQIAFGFDEPKDIDEQFSVGSGLGYQLWDTELSALSIVTGLDYTKRNFDTHDAPEMTADGSSDETINWRGGTDFRYRLPLSIGLFHRNEILWSLSSADDWEINSETGVLIPLGSGLFSDFKVEYDYDNSVANNLTKKSDTRIKLGLGYEW